MRDFLAPDRIVIGAFADEDSAAVEALYGGIDAPVVRTDVASAEMIKLASNAFLTTRSRRAAGSTTGSVRTTCAPGSDTAAAAFRRTPSR